jgi:hypothetical protein
LVYLLVSIWAHGWTDIQLIGLLLSVVYCCIMP